MGGWIDGWLGRGVGGGRDGWGEGVLGEERGGRMEGGMEGGTEGWGEGRTQHRWGHHRPSAPPDPQLLSGPNIRRAQTPKRRSPSTRRTRQRRRSPEGPQRGPPPPQHPPTPPDPPPKGPCSPTWGSNPNPPRAPHLDGASLYGAGDVPGGIKRSIGRGVVVGGHRQRSGVPASPNATSGGVTPHNLIRGPITWSLGSPPVG